ncbi:MAG: thiamine phosphate synthase [Pyrinomonadaceae bacterium]
MSKTHGKFFDCPIYPITDRSLSGLSHKEQIESIADTGVRMIQIREKHLDSGTFFKEASDSIAVTRRFGIKLIINDRVDIAMAVGADGVHLGQTDLPPVEARKLLGDDAIIGFSTHDSKQAIEALKMPIDYLAFGPVFETTTKADPDPVTGVDKLIEIRKLAGKMPLVAIGGIKTANFSKVLGAGADMAALISEIWTNKREPRAVVAEFIGRSR